MQDQGVNFLNAGGVPAWDDDFMVTEAAGLAAIAAGEHDGGEPLPGGRLEGGDDVGAVAARGEADENIATPAQGFHTARKNVCVTIVVANAGDGSGIRIEAQGRQCAAFEAVTSDEFLGEVKRVSGTAAIAASEEFATREKTCYDRLSCAFHGRCEGEGGAEHGLQFSEACVKGGRGH